MSKIYVQNMPVVLDYSASLAAKGSTTGSLICNGYARIVGLHWSNASAESVSGLEVRQSANGGTNWDYVTRYVPAANSGSAFSVEIIGDAVQVFYKTDSAAASIRSLWQLRPV